MTTSTPTLTTLERTDSGWTLEHDAANARPWRVVRPNGTLQGSSSDLRTALFFLYAHSKGSN